MLKFALRSAVFVAAVGLGVTGSARAGVLTVNFNGPTYSDGALNAPSPTTDTTTPGQDGWLNTSGGGTNNISVSNSATNGLITLTTSGQDVRHLFDGSISITSGSVYFSADITVTSAQSGGDYFIHLGDGGTSAFNARTYIKSSGTGFVMAEGTGSGTATYGTTVLPFNTLTHILVRYDLVAGAANDTGALFVNPTTADGSGDTPYVTATTIGTDASTLSALYLRQGTASSAPGLTVDNISVTAVPEPASFAGVALAGAGLLVRRRRPC